MHNNAAAINVNINHTHTVIFDRAGRAHGNRSCRRAEPCMHAATMMHVDSQRRMRRSRSRRRRRSPIERLPRFFLLFLVHAFRCVSLRCVQFAPRARHQTDRFAHRLKYDIYDIVIDAIKLMAPWPVVPALDHGRPTDRPTGWSAERWGPFLGWWFSRRSPGHNIARPPYRGYRIV